MNVIENIKSKFEISDIVWQKNDLTFLTVDQNHLEMLLLYLKNYENYTHLAFVNAVDWIEDEKFQLIYMLGNYQSHHNLGIRVFIDRNNPSMTSIHKLWKHAWQFQRELKELFGIDFPDSPRVNESFVLEGWDNMPPMRRDFDTKKYSEETYAPRPGREKIDPKTFMKEKLWPDFPENTPKGDKQ